MSFGRKGLAPGQAAPAPGGFGRAAPAADVNVAQPVDDVAAKREAFIAAERARAQQSNGATASAPAAEAPPEHDPLINLRNMSRPARPAQPMPESANSGPFGASGMSAQQEAEIRAAARGMARNQAPPAAARYGAGYGRSSGKGYFFGDPASRNLGLAYVLWFVLGQFSLHRFYCGQTETAFAQMGLWMVGLITLFVFPPMGLIALGLWFIWIIGDLFMIPGMLEKFKRDHDYSGVFA